MALPQDERLPAALGLLSDLIGHDREKIEWLRWEMSIPPMAARMLLVLNAAYPRIVPIEALMTALWGYGANVGTKNLHVYACRINKARPGLILSSFGVGYSIAKPLRIGDRADATPPRHCRAWTAENDEDLRRMVTTGSTVAAIAYELDRTEKAVADRMRHLKARRA